MLATLLKILNGLHQRNVSSLQVPKINTLIPALSIHLIELYIETYPQS